MMHSCGIDFGTSNSALCAVTQGDASIVGLEGDHATLPSALFFNTEENRIAYGRQATDEYLEGYGGRYMRALKSILGSDLMKDSTQVGKKFMSFPDIIGLFIRHLKQTAERKLGHELDNVVLGRPVHYVDGDDIADKRAEDELRAIAAAQGFKNISFEFEPLAAARDYESGLTREELVLVVDIGGGTSDFTVIRLSPESRTRDDRADDILANDGIHIGGTDFDKQFSLSAVMPGLGYKSRLTSGLDMPINFYQMLATWHLINFLYTGKNLSAIKTLEREAVRRDLLSRLVNITAHQRGHELASKVEAAKIALSATGTTSLDLGFVEAGWTLPLTLDDLAQAAARDIAAIVNVALDTVTRQAGLTAGRIDTIFMTGGSTALPGFEQAVRDAFPGATVNYGDRFSSVARGLGLCALRRYGA